MSPAPDLPGDLLSLAREDLAAAEALDQAERVSDAPVGFHAQQAVEKALKAAIASCDQDFPFTHDVGLLMQLCQDAGLELPADLAESDRLTPYAAAPLRPGRSGRCADVGCLALGCARH
jgi:HEPN domain-containing protein